MNRRARRTIIVAFTAAFLLLPLAALNAADAPKPIPERISLINTTDIYHPPQDPGDNFDLIAAYALPEIDLKAVILDATEKHRWGREPGFIPVLQLNSIFGRNVPCGTTPYVSMKSPDDKMLDAPAFQQSGIELLLETLRRSKDPVEITIFGSARAVAVAFNRESELLRQHVRRIHLWLQISNRRLVRRADGHFRRTF